MSSEPGPEAVPLDPGSGEVPPPSRQAFTGPDHPIQLLVAPIADVAAARTAFAMAEALAGEGQEVILADAGVDAPRLHRLLNVPNLEGLVDVFLFGASLDRVSVRPGDRSFDFVPAGAYAPEAAAVLESGRWTRIADELGRAGGRLLVFAPAETPGLGALSRTVGSAIIIGDEAGAAIATDRLDPSCRVEEVVEPDTGVHVEGAGRMSDAAAASLLGDAALQVPPVFRHTQPSRKASPLLLVLLLILAAAAGWLVYDRYIAGDVAPVQAAQSDGPASPAMERGAAIETPLPISVAIEAHLSLESALPRVNALRRAQPDVAFYLAPVSVNGDLYYRLLAGPAADRDAGMQLMQRLVDAGHKTAVDVWAIRPTTLAFHLGDFDSRAAAASREEALLAEEIPAYIVPVRHDPGPPRFRLYGGAYENQGEAAVMREMLENADIEARLVSRTGEPAG